MLTPDDIRIKQIEYPELGTTEWQVQLRKYATVRTGIFKTTKIPTEEFVDYMEYDGYTGITENKGRCLHLDSARKVKMHLLEPYYRQPEFTKEKIVE